MSSRLTEALDAGNYVLARQIIERGFNPEFRAGLGDNALHRLRGHNGHVELFDLLVSLGCDIKCINEDGLSLFRNVGVQDAGICRRLIDAGLDIHHRAISGMTPLHLAVGNTEAVRMLIAAGADVHARSRGGRTPLLRAAGNGYRATCELLVAHGADVRDVNEKGQTILHVAAGGKDMGVVKFLIDQGADIDALDEEGKTPLHYAARTGSVTACRALVEAGASSSFAIPNAPKGYLTPFQDAVYAGKVGVVSFMHDHCGEQPYQKTPSGMRLMALTRNRPEMRDFITSLRNEITLRAGMDDGEAIPAGRSRSRSAGPTL